MHNLLLVYFANLYMFRAYLGPSSGGIARSKRDGTRAETRFGLSAKRTSPFKSAGFQFSRLLVVEECGSADNNWIDRVPTYSARLLATHSIRIFPLHFPSRASPCAIRFRTRYTTLCNHLVLIILFRWLCVCSNPTRKRQSSKKNNKYEMLYTHGCRLRLKCDGTRPEIRLRLSGEMDESI